MVLAQRIEVVADGLVWSLSRYAESLSTLAFHRIQIAIGLCETSFPLLAALGGASWFAFDRTFGEYHP